MVTVQIEGPGKNSLSSALIADLRQQIAGAHGEPLLFTGSGDSFSAGLDLKEVLSLDERAMASFLEELSGLLTDIFRYDGPTVAAVNGHAIAGGALVAMCCDYRVITSNPRSKMGLNEVVLGLLFPPWMMEIARYRVNAGPSAERVLLGGELFGPEAALAVGLVDEVNEDVVGRATKVLTRLSRTPRDSYIATKRSLRQPIGQVNEAGKKAFYDKVVPVWASPEVKERIAGFFKPRKG